MFCEHGSILRPIKTRDAIKAALEAKGKPVAWYHVENNKVFFTSSPSDDLIGKYWTPLYTTPPQRTWVGLTDEEIDGCDWGQSERDFARAIEAKLKEKNGL